RERRSGPGRLHRLFGRRNVGVKGSTSNGRTVADRCCDASVEILCVGGGARVAEQQAGHRLALSCEPAAHRRAVALLVDESRAPRMLRTGSARHPKPVTASTFTRPSDVEPATWLSAPKACTIGAAWNGLAGSVTCRYRASSLAVGLPVVRVARSCVG